MFMGIWWRWRWRRRQWAPDTRLVLESILCSASSRLQRVCKVTRANPTQGAPAETGDVTVARMKAGVLAAMALAYSIELLSRYLRAGSLQPPWVLDALTFAAVVLLGGSGAYLILRLQDRPWLKAGALVAAAMLLGSRGMHFLRNYVEYPALETWLAEHGSTVASAESLMLLGGIMVMLLTFYLALIETVAMEGRLARESRDLAQEVDVRRRAQFDLQESREELRALSTHLVQVREEERTRIAREVHDELGQTVTILKLDMAGLRHRTDAAPELRDSAEIQDLLASMSTALDDTMSAVRRIIAELRPGVLDDLGLIAAVEWQARDFSKRTGIECEIDLPAEKLRVGHEVSTSVFRILQEALTNILRHAEATRVQVMLRREGDNLLLRVQDNGRGMKLDTPLDGKHFGLLGMRERVRSLSGELLIDSDAGEGTTLTVRVPTEPASPA